MTGKPQRMFPKVDMQMHIPGTAFRGIEPLFWNPQLPCRSFSQLFECLLFLSEAVYKNQQDVNLLDTLAEAKRHHLVDFFDPERPEYCSVHVKLDPEARDFANILYRRNRNMFNSKSELLACMLYIAGHLAKTPEGQTYLMKRLEAVMVEHPTRKQLKGE